MTPAEDSAAMKLRRALDLHAFGVALMRQNLRRRHPRAGSDEIDAMVAAWLRNKPALGGPGLSVTWLKPPEVH